MLGALDELLGREGADVTCEVWAGDVLKILAEPEKQFDLVITDLSMPFISGLTALNAIRKFFPRLPIIVLTAFTDADIKNECLRQGASAFLEKPVESLRLLETIEKVLEPRTDKTAEENEHGRSAGKSPAQQTKKNNPGATKSHGNGRRQTFAFTAPDAMSVQLVGDFTQWGEHPISLRNAGNGVWETTVDLPKGIYHYRFLVDGEWRDDPTCTLRVANEYGSHNAVAEID